jgi:phage/plasmid-like protein (TIGR03299 family)
MGHNIFFNEDTKQHAFFSVHQKAWHGLGQIVSDYPTSAAAMQYAGLDFEVSKRGLFATAGNSDIGNLDSCLTVPDYYATIRTDNNTVLGVVGKDYEVVQNRDAFSFFDAIVGGEGILYETAGALGKGERIFITAKLPAYIKVGNDDLIEQYLFLTTSHDGSGSIMAAFTPVRIVCANTLNAALKNCSNAVRIKHTANAKERLEQAHKIMGMSDRLSAEMEIIFNSWSKVSVSDNALKQLIEQAMAPNKETLSLLAAEQKHELSTLFKNTCEEVFTYAMEHETQQTETTKGTLFGAYNAVTGYYQNVRKWKTGEAKLKSILLGGTAHLRGQKAFDACSAFMGN